MGELMNAPIPNPHVLQIEGLQIGDHRLSTSCRSSNGLIIIAVMILFNFDNCQLEVASDVTSDVAVEATGVDVRVKVCDSRSNRSRDI